MKVHFFNYYCHDKLTPQIGDTLYGNHLAYPSIMLEKRMEDEGFYKTFDEDFDIAIFTDPDEDLMRFALSLPSHIKKILHLCESPIYTPYGHHPRILFSNIWSSVVTYNREFDSSRLQHYDIPVTGIQCPLPSIPSVKDTLPRGVFIGNFKNDRRGFGLHIDNLMLQLAEAGIIDIYGHGWPNSSHYCGKTDDKIKILSQYRYVVCSENAKYSGYVTEKIGDSILAERPCLYFGDALHAHKRFGKTFIELPALSLEAFHTALKKLNSQYDTLYTTVLKEKDRSEHWIDSFIENMLQALWKCK